MKKITHNGREVEDNAVDYGNGEVMVRYKDNGQIIIVDKAELVIEESQ